MSRIQCDGKICRICIKEINENQDACGVVVPHKKLLKSKAKSQFQINWDLNQNSNYFHQDCWDNTFRTCAPAEKRILNSIDEVLEKFDNLTKIQNDAKLVAQMLRESSFSVCFTGAGVSAAAGIPTYRGIEGIDTIAHFAENENTSKKRKVEEEEEVIEEEEEEFTYTSLQPTFTHKSLAVLNQNNMMHYCITQNCDDLHGKGGFPRNSTSDLHGNVFIEYCENCYHEYIRDYEVDAYSTDCYNEPWYKVCRKCKWGHYTGRICDRSDDQGKQCNGKLRDTIVNFGDDLHESVLGGLPKAEESCRKADLCVCLGSSLTVTPASNIPLMSKKLVICNLQETKLDNNADVRVWATCDLMFKYIMEELNITVN
jgi:mono-ADP-ribosyltransferase sirtuin 6